MTRNILYTIFAILSTIVNLFTQEVASILFQYENDIAIAILMGTLAGLVVKYLLDKKYIFKYKVENQKKGIINFFFYSLTGVVTTTLFWFTEYIFDLWFETKTMRYTGAVIGLSIGYVTKYYLDKKYVFLE